MGTGWKRYPAAKRGVPAYRQAGMQQPACQVEKKEKAECPQNFLRCKRKALPSLIDGRAFCWLYVYVMGLLIAHRTQFLFSFC